MVGGIRLHVHASAGVEQQPNRKRGIFAREMRDLLFDAVFENAEILFLEPEHEPVHRIGDGDGNHHQSGIDYDVLGSQEGKR